MFFGISNNFFEPLRTIGLGVILLFVGIYTYIAVKKSIGRNKKFYNKSIRLDVVINFLQHIKIIKVEADLMPIIKTIENLYSDPRLFDVDDYETLWMDDVVKSIGKINGDIIKQKLISSNTATI